ncbi:MAG: hypothetical protein M3161_02990 [Actinomycetota bacterium]|nr:hypothetical protein [Actinomycetota bacterium]
MELRRYVDVIDRFVGGLVPVDEGDRAAGFEIAVASRHFSRTTKAVVDDKLSFSATLMRAGEVEAANRLLAEVEDEVLSEEAALLEKVNEVKVARSIERRPVTRLHLARALAVAVLGSSLLASSAVGMAVAGLFRDRDARAFDVPSDARGTRGAGDALTQRRAGNAMKHISIAGIPMRLTRAEFRQYSQLTSGRIDEDRLETFLLSVLPAPLAEAVHSALVVGSSVTPDEIDAEMAELSRKAEEERRKAEKAATTDEAAKDDEQPADEPSPDPSQGSEDDTDETDDTKDQEEGDDDPPLPLLDEGT